MARAAAPRAAAAAVAVRWGYTTGFSTEGKLPTPKPITSEPELATRLKAFNDQYAEARLLIDDATESVGTTYFEEDLVDAKEGTESTVGMYEGILRDCAGDAGAKMRGKVEAENKLKVAQLKEQYLEVQKHCEE